MDDVRSAFATVDEADERVRKAEERLVDAQFVLQRAVRDLRDSVRAIGETETLTPDHRDAMARRIYWRHPRVPVADIVDAFGYITQRHLLAIVGTVATTVECRGCGAPLRATSRSRLSEIDKLAAGRRVSYSARGLECDDCVAASNARRERDNKVYFEHLRALEAACVTLPVVEWSAIGALVLQYPPLLAHDDWSWRLHDLASEVSEAASRAPASEGTLSIRYRIASQLTEVVADIAAWDPLGGTRLIRELGVQATVGELARRLGAACGRVKSEIGPIRP